VTTTAPPPGRTPLFEAQHASRYDRQALIRSYEELTDAALIVLIDQIFPEGMTLLEELLFDCDPTKPLHLLLASPGGDGETAIRMVRSIQARCSELTVIVPDMAKSAATLLCLGADKILMGPAGDLGPVDPQFPLPAGEGEERRSLAGAK
jgi:ClpP class serine protease